MLNSTPCVRGFNCVRSASVGVAATAVFPPPPALGAEGPAAAKPVPSAREEKGKGNLRRKKAAGEAAEEFRVGVG